MDELLTWLRAQLDADEQGARQALEDLHPALRSFTRHAHVLRQVAAHRAILDHVERELADTGGDNPWWYADRLLPVIQHLAAAFADRPGYRDEWRP